eukprot:TRINITY_DN2711_c0_g1_i1.p1 TRINITY_DN2711_c0_g1~~TRINITY_DN2711_c0_g1_i1.p1  ORF type:complete len:369 (+),score=28.34 TRINITY_DN2711_c0_g1_i1:96-1109(+)
MLRNFALLLVIVGAALAIVPDKDRLLFERYMLKYNKGYENDADMRTRFLAFKQKLRYIETFNAEHKVDDVQLGVNDMTDRTATELAERRSRKFNSLAGGIEMPAVNDISGLPASVDWREKGVVGPVEDQGECGAAGAYAGVDAVASCHAIETNSKFVELSIAQVLDCSTPGGCNGGMDASSVFAYIESNGGIDAETCYPEQLGHCGYKASCCESKLKNYTVITSGNEHTLQAAVATTPVAAGIDASQPSFEMYSGGIYYEPSCSKTQADHTVLIVGYGSTGGQDYWIAKNSWGTSWGIEGYILMARNRGNNCGIASFAAVPQGCPSCADAKPPIGAF